MSTSNPERVVALFEGHPDGLAGIATAAAIAQRLGVGVDVVFLENLDLLRLAALPGSRQVGTVPPVARPLSTASLEAEWRAAEARTRTSVAHEAEQRGVPWELRVERRDRVDAVMAALHLGSPVVLGAMRWAPGLGPVHLRHAPGQAGIRAFALAAKLVEPAGQLLVHADEQEIASLEAIAIDVGVEIEIIRGTPDELASGILVTALDPTTRTALERHDGGGFRRASVVVG